MDPLDNWIVVQLTGWGQKILNSETIDELVLKYLKLEALEIYYPIGDATFKKVETAYSEYVFLEYIEGVDYSKLS